MTRILVIHYSQTGQLNRAAKSMMAPLENRKDVEIVWQNIEPVNEYPFPWNLLDFFDTFPESVYLDPPAIKPMQFDPDSHFDLVILTYQVWFLSPSLPFTAFLKSPAARVLKNKPVITLIVCRNMWLTAQEKVRKLLAEHSAHLIDNIVLMDSAPAWATFITTPRWMLTGRQNAFWGIFPAAGVSETDIAAVSRFGRALSDNLPLIQSGATHPLLSGLGAVKVMPGYIASERIGHRSFLVWGRLLRAIGKPGQRVRRAVLLVYIAFLITLILTVVPAGLLLRVLLRPLIKQKLDREAARLEQPSGSGTERMQRYAQ